MKLHPENTIYYSSLGLMILFMGLFYQVAWQYPVVDSFPLIERIMNPNFLTNDFYTNTFDAFSPRLILATCIAWISQTLDVHYTYIVAYLNIVRIWLYAIGLYLFFRTLAGRNVALIAFTLSALSFLSVPFLPAWWPVTYDFTASNVALVFSMFAWALVLNNKVSIALILLTLSVLFHPLVGVHSLLISVILFIAYHNWSTFLSLFKQPGVYVSGIIFSIVFLSLYFSFDKVLDSDRFVEINGHYRHAHHFLLSHMDLEKWISTALMLSVSIYFILKLDIPKSIKYIASTFFIYAITLTILGYIFVEVFPTRFMVSFIPMRAFPIIVPIMVLLWAYFTYQTLKNGNILGFFILFMPFLPYHHVGLTWFVFPESHQLALPILMLILCFTFVIISNNRTLLTSKINRFIHSISCLLFKSESPSIYILPMALASFLLAILMFKIEIPNKDSDVAIYDWLNKQTNEEDVILAELNAANNQKIRLLSQRAVVISKDFPFNERFYEQWYERYQSVYVERDSARGHIDKLDLATLKELMEQFSANIVLRTKPLADSANFTLIGQVQGETGNSFAYRYTPEETGQ